MIIREGSWIMPILATLNPINRSTRTPMKKPDLKKTLIILAHAFVIWALCGATIAVGRSSMSMEATLIVHAVGAPVFAALVSAVYFRRFHFTPPLLTSVIFLLFIVAMDAGLVAPVFEKSYAMFTSPLGTWIPFALIFLSSYVTGRVIRGKSLS